MPFWVLVVFFFATTIVGQLITPKPKGPAAAKADEFDFPTSTADRSISHFCGKALEDAPNLIDWFDYHSYPIKKRQGLSITKQLVGYRYNVGAVLSLGYKVEKLHKITFDDKVAWTGTAVGGDRFLVRDDNLFGGELKGGGVAAWCDFYDGTQTEPNDYLVSFHGDYPALIKQAYLVWRGPSSSTPGGYIGTSPRWPAIKIEKSRYPAPLNGNATKQIGDDANPVEFLFECLTDPMLGCGWPSGLFDLDSWRGAVQQCFDDNIGITYEWEVSKPLEELVSDILKVVNGVTYIDFFTGKISLKIARPDYDIATIPHFSDEDDIDNVIEVISHDEGSIHGRVNEVIVNYKDRNQNYQTVPAKAQDEAQWQQTHSVNSAQQDYKGICSAELAGRLALRDLRVLSAAIGKTTLALDRSGWELRPGSVFKWTWTEENIVQRVMRVTSVTPGTLAENRVEVTCSPDVFAIGDPVFGTNGSEWTNPIGPAHDITDYALTELPYHLDGNNTPNVMAAAGRPGGDHLSYDLYASSGSTYTRITDASDFTPWGALVNPISAVTNYDNISITVAPGQNLELLDTGALDGIARGEFLLMIDDEIFGHTTFTIDGSGNYVLNVDRALLDTLPQAHAANAKVWFISYGAGLSDVDYSVGSALTVKFLPRTGSNELKIDDATPHSITLNQRRAERPYPPADLMINGSRTLTDIAVTDDVTLTWKHRDRAAQRDVILQSAASVGPEAGVTYTIRVHGDGNTLLHTETGVTGTSYNYSLAQEASDSGGAVNATLRFEVEAVRGGLASWKMWNRSVARPALAYGYGNRYGDNGYGE
jgi:hypothetical protein